MSERHFEDLSVGEEREFGTYEVTKAEIVEFGERYDPQPFHVDEEAASESAFGGLIASGWHTCSMTMRLLVDGYLSGIASLGSPGIDEIRFHEPVRPGDSLSVRLELVGKIPSESRPNRGLVRLDVTTLEDGGEAVMTMTALGMVARR